MTSVVEVNDVTFSYRRRRVLTGASWSVERGVTALLGPNGSGKTTLMKCLVGLLTPASGSIVILGRSMSDRADRRLAQRRIGFVPQNPSLPSTAKVRDAVAYAAWLSGVPRHEIESSVHKALEDMRLQELAGRRIGTLSGGQRQRVALATGAVHDPELLVLDEPTVGLDPGQRLKVREVIKDIGRTRAVVLSTHLTEDAQYVADSVAVLIEGQVRYQGPLDELTSPDRRPDAAGRPGSAFEQAYDDLMVTLGGTSD